MMLSKGSLRGRLALCRFSKSPPSLTTGGSSRNTTSIGGTPKTPSGPPSSSQWSTRNLKTQQEKEEYLHRANQEMERYHIAREQMRRNTTKNSDSSNSWSAQQAQLGIAVLFLGLFFTTPWLGRKIARDEEFRSKYVPDWYNFTVPKPERPWTRDELHEQMLQVHYELRQRAIRGEFTEDKLKQMENSLLSPSSKQQTTKNVTERSQKIPEGMDRIHPGLEEGESVNEDD